MLLTLSCECVELRDNNDDDDDDDKKKPLPQTKESCQCPEYFKLEDILFLIMISHTSMIAIVIGNMKTKQET